MNAPSLIRSIESFSTWIGKTFAWLIVLLTLMISWEVFSRYVLTRHRDGDMADMDFDDYRAMVEESPVETAIVEFRDDSAEGRLVGACLVDWLSNGVSAVYSFFDPQDPRRGLGTHMILWLANAAAKRGLPYVYLGYWIAQSRKMAYKARFAPLEQLVGAVWRPLDVSAAESSSEP